MCGQRGIATPLSKPIVKKAQFHVTEDVTEASSEAFKSSFGRTIVRNSGHFAVTIQCRAKDEDVVQCQAKAENIVHADMINRAEV